MSAKLSFSNIVIITLATVANARNISSSYAFGNSVFFYDIVVCFLFFLPASLIVGKFTSNCENDGGIYSWVTTGLGWRAGALAIWLQWLENVFYYPLSLLFILSSIAEMFSYSMTPLALCLGTNLIFWCLTYVNIRGIEYSSKWIEALTVLGLFIPLFTLVMASLLALYHSNETLNIVSMDVPTLNLLTIKDPLLITLAGFLGVEINAAHASKVKNPSKTIPQAILTSSLLIMLCIVGGTWLMMAWLPNSFTHVGNAFAQSLTQAMQSMKLGHFSFIVIFLMLLGPLGGITAWIISPVQVLHQCIENVFPKHAHKTSMFVLLILQACLVTFISFLYFIFDIEGLFTMMTDSMVALYLIMYILMFLSALCSIDDREIFISNTITRLCCFLGLFICSFCFVLCFWKEGATMIDYIAWFALLIVGCFLPLIFLMNTNDEIKT